MSYLKSFFWVLCVPVFPHLPEWGTSRTHKGKGDGGEEGEVAGWGVDYFIWELSEVFWRRTFFFSKILFIRERERERQRHRQREKQASCREPDVGLDPKIPGFQDSRIIPWAEGRRSNAEPPRDPLEESFKRWPWLWRTGSTEHVTRCGKGYSKSRNGINMSTEVGWSQQWGGTDRRLFRGKWL